MISQVIIKHQLYNAERELADMTHPLNDQNGIRIYDNLSY